MLHRLGACLTLALTLLFGSTALAQEPDQDAIERSKQLYANGTTLYEEGNYAQAAQAFEEAYTLSEREVFLYNISNAWERAGDLDKALDYLNQYRVYATPEEAAKLDRRLVSLERRILEEERAETAKAMEIAKAAEEAKAAALAETEAAASQVAPAPVMPQPVITPKRGSGPLGPVLLGGGAVLGVGFGAVAGVTYARSRTHLDELDRESYEDLRPLNQASIVVAGVGGGVALTGLALTVLGRRTASDRALGFSASPAPDGVHLGLTVHSW